jgi:hypothetical protein
MAKVQQISWTGDVINIAYGNGEKFDGDCLTLPKTIYQPCDASRHGIAQKLGDAKSGGTASEKYAEVLEIWAGMQAGNWNRKGGMDDTIIQAVYLILAHATGLKGKAAEEKAGVWFASWQQMTEADRDKVRAKDYFKAALKKAKADKGIKSADFDDGGQFDPNAV